MKNLVDRAYAIGMAQVREEITALASLLRTHTNKSFIEIGTKFGGTFFLFHSCMAPKGQSISIDLPGGIHGGWVLNDHPYLGQVNTARDKFLLNLGDNVRLISGNSHSLSTTGYLDEILHDHVDFLFIDGDHTYDGVKQDYEMYSQYVKPGGMIAFHDINDTEYHRAVGAEAFRFWKELQGNKLEINAHSYFGGIGVLFK